MSVFKIVSRATVPVIGNRAIVSGFTHLPSTGIPTLGPGLSMTKGFSIEYNDNEPVFDRLLTFGAIDTTDGAFPGFAYGIVAWDLDSLLLRCESREEEVEGDAAVPAPYFTPSASEEPPPVFRRASYLIGASLGMMAFSQIGFVYPIAWNQNVAIKASTGTVYRFDPWVAQFDDNAIMMVTSVDFNPAIVAEFVFILGETGAQRVVALDSKKLYVYVSSGVVNAQGRMIYDQEEVFDTPEFLHRACWINRRTICGITTDKTLWTWAIDYRVFWMLSALDWPDSGVEDNYLDSDVQMVYDTRRGRVIIHQPRAEVSGDPGTFIGNFLHVYSLIPVASKINDPVPLDTVRIKKRNFWFTKIVGSRGELITSKRVNAVIDDPQRGRLTTSQGTTNARGQVALQYGGGSEASDAGDTSITVSATDTPGISG